MGLIDFVRSSGSSPAPQEGQPAFVVIDTETTGLSPRDCRLLEIAIVTLDFKGRVLHEWTTLLDPQGAIGATRVHGITKRDVDGAPTFQQVAGDVAKLLNGAVPVAHNARFDLAFLRAEFARMEVAMPDLHPLCTLEASHYYLPNLPRRKLADCCEAVGLEVVEAHSALGDARATAGLLGYFIDEDRGRKPRREDLRLFEFAQRVVWPRRFLEAPVRASLLTREEARREALGDGHTLLKTMLSEVPLSFENVPGGGPEHLSYLELLAQSLEDSVLSPDEMDALRQLAEAMDLDGSQVTNMHESFLDAMTSVAFRDGFLSNVERAEIEEIASLLNVSPGKVSEILASHAAKARSQLAAEANLPSDWDLGRPLYRGDAIVCTGAFPNRTALESYAREVGIRVASSVSKKTAVLATDGSFNGNKLAAAVSAGVRIVTPEQLEELLHHVQERPIAAADRPEEDIGAEHANEALDPARVREWAVANGFPIGNRGRLSLEIQDAYRRALDEETA